jgi:hypothetical protein
MANGRVTRMIRLDRGRFQDGFEGEETDRYRMNELNLISSLEGENVILRDGDSGIVLHE